MPSVLAATVGRLLTQNEQGQLDIEGQDQDRECVTYLLTLINDFGITRYDTDSSWNERYSLIKQGARIG